MDFDAVIAKATDPVAPQGEASKEAPADIETPQNASEPAPSEDVGQKPDSELTQEQLAKREANRKSHQASREARLKREVRELREFQQRVLQQSQAQPQNTNDGRPVKPNAENFQTWEELEAANDKYIEQLAEWKLERKLSERESKSQESRQDGELKQIAEKQLQTHASKEAEFAAKVPDYEATVYGEYSEFMGNMPLPVQQALFEADAEDVSPALYALAKEGLLEHLEDMTPSRMGVEIGKAAVRGKQYLNQNRATNAPAPMRAAKGSGEIGKSISRMTTRQKLEYFST